MRHGLSDTAQLLLQPHFISGKAVYVVQKASRDNKTPLELAHKHGLTRAAEMAESLVPVSEITASA